MIMDDNNEILKKLNLERGVEESQVGVKFSFLISPTSSVGTEVGPLAHAIKNLVFREIKCLNFESPITGFVLFPSVVDPAIFVRENSISYKRKDKCFYITEVIPYKVWMNAGLAERVDLLSDSLIVSLDKVPVKHFFYKEKQKVIEIINAVREYLKS